MPKANPTTVQCKRLPLGFQKVNVSFLKLTLTFWKDYLKNMTCDDPANTLQWATLFKFTFFYSYIWRKARTSFEILNTENFSLLISFIGNHKSLYPSTFVITESGHWRVSYSSGHWKLPACNITKVKFASKINFFSHDPFFQAINETLKPEQQWSMIYNIICACLMF